MYGKVISMNDEMIVKGLKALGDPTRLHIIGFLSNCACCTPVAVQEDGGIEGPTAGEICCHITGAEKITSTVSHHLHELANAGLISIDRKGKTMVCTLQSQTLLELANKLTKLAKGENNGGCC